MIFKQAYAPLVGVSGYIDGVTSEYKAMRYAGSTTKIDKNCVYSEVIGIQGDRFNENDDYWPMNDTLLAPPRKASKNADISLKHQYQTWIGKPNCRNHVNRGPEDHYGSVIDTTHVANSKDILMILATDRRRNAQLVEDIESGKMNTVSMGCLTAYTTCSVCGNIAESERKYCYHIKYQKGMDIPINSGMNYYPGAKIASTYIPLVHVGEICHDIVGAEMSWVDNPAFPECVKQRILAKSESSISMASSIMTPELRDKLMLVVEDIGKRDEPLMRETAKALGKACSKKDLTDGEVRAITRTIKLLSKK